MSNLPVQKNAWDQWPDETNLAYQRFSVYLEMGPERSLEKVHQKLNKSTSYKRQLAKWSTKYDWVARCKEYDDHLLKKSLKNKEDILDRARAKLLNRLDHAIDKLFDMMDEPIYYNNSTVEEDESTGTVTRTSISTNMANQIKIIHDLMDRVGLVAPDSLVDPGKNTDDATYIQNIYNQIENIYPDRKKSDEE